jgi:hypothetical protein
MTHLAQFAKMPTGEIGVVIHADLKKRRVTIGTQRSDKKGGRESLSMFADALAFKDGTVVCKEDPWWYGPWVHFEEEGWQDFDDAFPTAWPNGVTKQYPIVPFIPSGP